MQARDAHRPASPGAPGEAPKGQRVEEQGGHPHQGEPDQNAAHAHETAAGVGGDPVGDDESLAVDSHQQHGGQERGERAAHDEVTPDLRVVSLRAGHEAGR